MADAAFAGDFAGAAGVGGGAGEGVGWVRVCCGLWFG
jgi:hypothetical protein